MKCRVSFPQLLVLLLPALFLLPPRTAAQTNPAHPLSLPPHQSIQVEIKPGEQHFYQVQVPQDALLYIAFSSADLLLSVALQRDPGETKAGDNLLKLPADGEIWYKAEKTGWHQFSVTRAGPPERLGHYSLRVEVTTQPSAEEQAKARAQLQLQQIWAQYYQGTAEDLTQAIRTGEALREFWQQRQHKRYEARVDYFLGEAYKSKEQFPAAVAAFQRALHYYQTENVPLSQAIILTSLGQIYASWSDYARATDYYRQALPLWTQGDAPAPINMIGWNLINLGHAYRAYGEWAKAVDYYRQAEACYRQYPNESSTEQPRGLGIVQASLGIIAFAQGEKQTALAHLQQAVAYFQQGRNPENEFAMYGRIGEVYASLGESEQAQRAYEQALQHYGHTNSLGEATILNSYGNLHRLTGNYAAAAEKLRQALTIRRQRGDRRGQALSLTNLGAVYAAQQHHQQALATYSEAQTLWQDIGDKYSQGYTLNYLGLAYYELHETAQARTLFQQALALRRATNDREGETNTLYNLARLDADAGNFAAARDGIASAIALSEAVRATVPSDDLRASYLATVREYYEFYMQVLMQMHRREPQAGHHAAAFAVSEMARARSLLDSLAAQRLPAPPNSEPALLTQEHALQQRLNAKAEYQRTLQQKKASPALQQAAAQELQTLIAEIKELRRHRQAAQPRLDDLLRFTPLDVATLQKTILDGNTALLAYSLGKERSYLWFISRDALASYELPARAVIEAAARAAYEQLRPREQPGDEAQLNAALTTLSHLVLAPVADKLKQQRLLIVADGALQYVPFAALPEPVIGDRWSVAGKNQAPATSHQLPGTGDHRSPTTDHRPPLIVNHELITLPSATFLQTIRQAAQQRTAPTRTIAVLADPVFDSGDVRVVKRQPAVARKPFTKPPELEQALRDVGATELPRLPYTRREAEAINALVRKPKRQTALDFRANRTTFLQTDWRAYGIVHLATHGLLNSTHPELSGLVFSLVDETGAPQPGFLRLHEIYNLRLNADLVVLSACQTGLGKEVRGEGLIGLTRGFLHAGATRVIASLWQVNDKATAELMRHFYQELLGEKKQSPAAALRAAQLTLWQQKRWRHPTYWAAFALQGEWK
jgi:CHAT domain-containing protein/tetratricopeptide (TPR) repeat protein